MAKVHKDAKGADAVTSSAKTSLDMITEFCVNWSFCAIIIEQRKYGETVATELASNVRIVMVE